MQLTDETLNTIAQMRDPAGVLSIFVDASPERQIGDPPPFEVSIRTALKRLVDRVHEEGPRERWVTLAERLEALEPALSSLLDTGEPGRGRALFAKLGDGAVESVALQLPLQEDVILGESAYVRPLVAALDAGFPAGVVTVSKNGVRAVDLRLGRAEELEQFAFVDSTDRDGGALPDTMNARNAGAQRELFERYLAENRERFLHSISEKIARLAADRCWDPVILAGDSRLTQTLADALRTPNGREIKLEERQIERLSPDEIGRLIAPELDQMRLMRELQLVEKARDQALGRGTGALGLRATLGALNEARVAHLLLDDTREHRGARAPDGRLSIAGEPPLGVEKRELVEEPRLAERMIERALEIDARVSLLRGPAVEVLGEHDGVAALLRW
jgi:hypothetical protein